MALTYTLIDMYTKSKRRQQLGLSMETTLWLNAAYYAGDSVGYYQGFRFFVSLNDLKIFLLDLQEQLSEMIRELTSFITDPNCI